MHDELFDYQRDVVAFCLRQGRAALFLDTGMGKSICTIEWCAQAAKASNGYALILTPLAVAKQFEREAKKFGYEARVVRSREDVKPGINICNYDRLDLLDLSVFGAVALDESSILKSFNGKTTRALISAFADTPYRLCATATPAPNDHMELGNHAEFLGIMNSQEMLARWFINDTSTASQQWRLKKSAVHDFWDWVASWARCAESPADLGYDASRFVLPPLNIHRHQAFGDIRAPAGALFIEDMSATNMFEIKRQTSYNRSKLAASIIKDSFSWQTDLNTTENIIRKIETQSSNESAEANQVEHQKKTENTCAHITPQTKTNLTTGRPSKKKLTTKQDAKGMPLMANIETASSRLSREVKIEIHKDISQDVCANTLELNCQTTMTCSNTRTELVLYADQETPDKINTSTLIIATTQVGLGASCAATATLASDNSKMIQKICEERRITSTGVKMPAWVLWCDTNDEQKMLESELGSLAISIYGSMTPETKERLHDEWRAGVAPVLITKPAIFSMGVNWQFCHNMAYVGRNFSYESFYQSVRRCWRFGQTRPVDVHLIVAEGEDQIGRVIDQKAEGHKTMKRAMADAMKRAAYAGKQNAKIKYNPTHIGEFPKWLKSVA